MLFKDHSSSYASRQFATILNKLIFGENPKGITYTLDYSVEPRLETDPPAVHCMPDRNNLADFRDDIGNNPEKNIGIF